MGYNKFGVTVSYSTARRGKSKVVSDVCGNKEDNFARLSFYMYMLEMMNHGTIISKIILHMEYLFYVVIKHETSPFHRARSSTTQGIKI